MRSHNGLYCAVSTKGQCGPAPHSCHRTEELHICRTYLLSTTADQLKAYALILSKVKMSDTHPIFENVTITTGSPGRPEESDCPICDETMVDQETLTHTNGTCNHSYHRACWERWMLGSPPATCPIDRERLRLRERISSSATTQDLAIYNAYMDAVDQETMRAGRTVAGPRLRLFNFLSNLYRERGLLLYVARDGLRDPVYHFVGEDEYVRRSIEGGAEDVRVTAGALNGTSTV